MNISALSDAEIDAFASCEPGLAALEALRTGQHAKRRLRLLALRRKLTDDSLSDVDEAFEILVRAEASDASAVNAILDRPLTDAWLARCLSGLSHRGANDGEVRADIHFLYSIAAAAARRAGLNVEVRIHAPGGRVFLPGVGGVGGLSDERPVVRSASTGVDIIGAESKVVEGGDGWLSPHALVMAGQRPWLLEVEDQDPYRDCFGYRPTEYLSGPAMAAFTELMAQAWSLIERDHPNHAEVMRNSLRAVVPLATPAGADHHVALSASSQLAYGSVAILVPTDAATLALLLIHEVQHMTLGGVLDLVDLYQKGGTARHHAPWRLDPRPIGQLLQGTFAHLGVTDFWRVHRLRGAADREKAEFEFALWRELTTRAIRSLSRSGELTAIGGRFVEGLRTTMDGWWTETVPEPMATAAAEAADADTVLWRFHNQRPAVGSAEALGEAFRGGDPCAGWTDPVIVTQQAIPARRGGLAAAIRESLMPSPSPDQAGSTMDLAEWAYVSGDLDGAVRAYLSRIAANLDDGDAWAGLAMTLRRQGREPHATVVAQRPDLVRALCGQGRPTSTAVQEVIGWLAGGSDRRYGDGGSM